MGNFAGYNGCSDGLLRDLRVPANGVPKGVGYWQQARTSRDCPPWVEVIR